MWEAEPEGVGKDVGSPISPEGPMRPEEEGLSATKETNIISMKIADSQNGLPPSPQELPYPCVFINDRRVQQHVPHLGGALGGFEQCIHRLPESLGRDFIV